MMHAFEPPGVVPWHITLNWLIIDVDGSKTVNRRMMNPNIDWDSNTEILENTRKQNLNHESSGYSEA